MASQITFKTVGGVTLHGILQIKVMLVQKFFNNLILPALLSLIKTLKIMYMVLNSFNISVS